jgi:ABC-type Mn2+/Zn2+ transport system ATPase subunit
VDALDLADVPIGELSGGQQQRVLLARALAAHASIYLLDEPTTGLDSVTQSLVDTVTAELAQAGCLVITATHDLAWVAASTGSFLALRGRECARGPAGRVLAPEVLAAVYGMPAA